MACLLLAPQASRRGAVSFTTGERDDLILRYPDLLRAVEGLKSRYVVGLHHNWHDNQFRYNPLFDFHLAGTEDLTPLPGTPAPPLVPLDACNFVPPFFAPTGEEKFWDVLFVARAVFFKGCPEFFRAIRALYDQGHALRVLFLCPVPPTGDAGLRKLYESLFSQAERQRFTFLTMPFDYPFPLDMQTLAHFYGASRIFVHSAPDERRCRVAAYAWAMEMPVVGMACIGSILSPELRKPPYFFEISDYPEFPDAILKALETSGKSDGAARAEVATTEAIVTLRRSIETLFGKQTISPLPFSSSELDIRMGRHHGLAFGKNRIEQDIGAFIGQLQSLTDVELAGLTGREADPEQALAAMARAVPRKVPLRMKDIDDRFRTTDFFKFLRKKLKGP
jgi:glycosyltransferase involved in cell wall biosynthesis